MENKLIIFDFDGVLVNSEEVHSQNLHILLNKLGYKCSLAESREAFTGKGIRIILEELKNNHNIHIYDHENTIKALREENKRCMHQVQAMPLAKEVLQNIKVPYCVASSSNRHHIWEIMQATGLNTYFHKGNYFGGEDLGKQKPNPAVYLHAIEQMEKEPHNCVAIEDSIVGVQAAVAANIPVVGFIGGKHVAKSAESRLQQAGAFAITHNLQEAVDLALEKIS